MFSSDRRPVLQMTPYRDTERLVRGFHLGRPDQYPLYTDLPSQTARFLPQRHENPKQRVHDVADVRLAMEGAFETTVSTSAESTGTPQLQVWQRPVPAAIAALVLVAITGLAVWTLKPTATQPVSRYAVSAAPSAPVELSNNGNDLAISPACW